ncbi:helix-turn-helix domain-containing protein [Sagittula salina]|uniref:Helix-turn-helix transcriptional regulator n=1 Tax=Sagittula salina TaxID=2820268 RepID=A0A940MXG6_9RHOB|nr:helix-turn-helix transcriptional regulator [Sagittula salina]MBP0484649.1 helix-turn-helix transcriptional regulator [Sagittula salina]
MKLQIKQVRRRKKVSQTALAEAIGISKGYMSQIESGTRKLSVEMQNAIANALRVNPSELVDFSAPSENEIEQITRAFENADPGQREMMLTMARAVLDRYSRSKH